MRRSQALILARAGEKPLPQINTKQQLMIYGVDIYKIKQPPIHNAKKMKSLKDLNTKEYTQKQVA